MIIYNPLAFNGLIVFTSWRGSTLFHALPYAMTSAGIASVLKFHPYFRPFMANRGSDSMFESAFSIQLFASLVGFLVVFRGNLSYNRWWEARTKVQAMSTAFGDGLSLMIAFDENAKTVEAYTRWKLDFVHMVSLLHALAMMCLRCDCELANLIEYTDSEDEEEEEEEDDDETMSRPIVRRSTGNDIALTVNMRSRARKVAQRARTQTESEDTWINSGGRAHGTQMKAQFRGVEHRGGRTEHKVQTRRRNRSIAPFSLQQSRSMASTVRMASMLRSSGSGSGMPTGTRTSIYTSRTGRGKREPRRQGSRGPDEPKYRSAARIEPTTLSYVDDNLEDNTPACESARGAPLHASTGHPGGGSGARLLIMTTAAHP